LLAAGFSHWYVHEGGTPWFEAITVPIVVAILSAPLAAFALSITVQIDRSLRGEEIFWSSIPDGIEYGALYFLYAAWPAILLAGAGVSWVMCRCAKVYVQAA
jgi:hypothetical protein